MNLFKSLISAKNEASSKRFVTLLIAAHFILASFVILFFSFYVIVVAPKGEVKPAILDLLKDVLYYDFMIISIGLGFIGVENFGQALIEKSKVAATSLINKEQSSNIEPKDA